MDILDNLTLAFIAKQEPNRILWSKTIGTLQHQNKTAWAQHARCCATEEKLVPGKYAHSLLQPRGAVSAHTENGVCAICNLPLEPL